MTYAEDSSMESRFVRGLTQEIAIRQMLPQSMQIETMFKFGKMFCTHTLVQVLKTLDHTFVQCQV